MPKLIPIAEYTDLASAYLAKAKLEGSGIYCALDNEYLVGVHFLYSGALGGVCLSVYENDVETALELLAEKSHSEESRPEFPALGDVSGPEEENPAPEAETVCPLCFSRNVEPRNFGRAFAAASLLLGIALPFTLRRNKCRACGHSWKTKKITELQRINRLTPLNPVIYRGKGERF